MKMNTKIVEMHGYDWYRATIRDAAGTVVWEGGFYPATCFGLADCSAEAATRMRVLTAAA